MSSWAHVVGCLRIDGIARMGARRSAVEDILGPIAHYDSDDATYDKCTLPMGSEGSMEYAITEYDTGLRWIAISIWGDLRDVSSVDSIVAWWGALLDTFRNAAPNPILIRDGVLRVEIEGSDPVILDAKA